MKDIAQFIGRTWSAIWFEPLSTTPLELTRIGIAGALLIHYGLATPNLSDFWGNSGWMPREILAIENTNPLKQSLLFYLNDSWHLLIFHYVFLASCTALLVGWKTSWVKWIVLVGQISYDHRNPMFFYGVDKILASLLLILCLAPIGRNYSLDRVLTVRTITSDDLTATLPAYKSDWAGACTRLMQIQMAILFFYSALSKLTIADWWNGDAVWFVFTTDEHYSPLILNIFASHYWLVNVATYGTVLIEIAYVFLIWQKPTRPYLLSAALLLHASFAILMGLFYFSFVMMMGHLSFVRPEWLSRIGQQIKRRLGDIQLAYDGTNALSVQSIRWILAFDGLHQIKLDDMRTAKSCALSIEANNATLFAITTDGSAFAGSDAYRYVALRVPGLWWLLPFLWVAFAIRKVRRLPNYNFLASRDHAPSEQTHLSTKDVT